MFNYVRDRLEECKNIFRKKKCENKKHEDHEYLHGLEEGYRPINKLNINNPPGAVIKNEIMNINNTIWQRNGVRTSGAGGTGGTGGSQIIINPNNPQEGLSIKKHEK
jgi:hypothetical protein